MLFKLKKTSHAMLQKVCFTDSFALVIHYSVFRIFYVSIIIYRFITYCLCLLFAQLEIITIVCQYCFVLVYVDPIHRERMTKVKIRLTINFSETNTTQDTSSLLDSISDDDLISGCKIIKTALQPGKT